MPSLRDHLAGLPEIRSRDLAAAIGRGLTERATPLGPGALEAAALTLLAHVVRDADPIREALVFERRRFERLVQLIHRLPTRGGDG